MTDYIVDSGRTFHSKKKSAFTFYSKPIIHIRGVSQKYPPWPGDGGSCLKNITVLDNIQSIKHIFQVWGASGQRCLVFVWQPLIANICSEFVKLEKIGDRYMVQCFYLKALSASKTKSELDPTLSEFAPSFATVKYWVAKLNWVRATCTNKHRSSPP